MRTVQKNLFAVKRPSPTECRHLCKQTCQGTRESTFEAIEEQQCSGKYLKQLQDHRS